MESWQIHLIVKMEITKTALGSWYLDLYFHTAEHRDTNRFTFVSKWLVMLKILTMNLITRQGQFLSILLKINECFIFWFSGCIDQVLSWYLLHIGDFLAVNTVYLSDNNEANHDINLWCIAKFLKVYFVGVFGDRIIVQAMKVNSFIWVCLMNSNCLWCA